MTSLRGEGHSGGGASGGGAHSTVKAELPPELLGSAGITLGLREAWEGCLIVEGTSLPSQSKGLHTVQGSLPLRQQHSLCLLSAWLLDDAEREVEGATWTPLLASRNLGPSLPPFLPLPSSLPSFPLLSLFSSSSPSFPASLPENLVLNIYQPLAEGHHFHSVPEGSLP